MEKQDTISNFGYSVYNARVEINDLIVETAFELMKKGVAEIYGVPAAEIISDDRPARFISARFAFYYAVSRFASLNTAKYLIGRDQTTISRGITKFWQEIDSECLEALRTKFFVDKFCDKLFHDERFIKQNFMYCPNCDSSKLIVTRLPDEDTPYYAAIIEALSASTLLENYKPVYRRRLAQK